MGRASLPAGVDISRAGTPAPRDSWMNICIDMRPALSRPTGVGIYLLNLVQALAEIDSENQYHLFSTSWRERYQPPKYGKNFYYHDHRWPGKMLHFLWNRFSFPSIESLLRVPIDVAHSPSPLLIPSKQAHRVTTVHDLYFYAHPDHTKREIRRDYQALIKKHSEESDAIIAVSEYTKQQLVEHLKIAPSHIYTIRHGVDSFFLDNPPNNEIGKVKAKFHLNRRYFLFVGNSEPRKNLTALTDAFQIAKLDMDLVIAGPSENVVVSDPAIRITDYVSKAELRALYKCAVALVIPSLDEGFGIPMLEAMACGTPVIASNLPVFHEIAPDAFLPVDPASHEAIAEALRTVSENEGMRAELAQKGKERIAKYSWKECAQKTLDLYRNL